MVPDALSHTSEKGMACAQDRLKTDTWIWGKRIIHEVYRTKGGEDPSRKEDRIVTKSGTFFD